MKLTPNYDLRWLRTYANISQAEAAARLKVNRVTFSNWERGHTSTPKEVLPLLAKALDLSVSVIPKDLAGDAQRDTEAVAFVAEVAKLTKTSSTLVAETVAAITEMAMPVVLPPIAIPPHLFRPSAMKKFNVPEYRWRDFTIAKEGEDIEALEAAGYSWAQSVEWRDTDARTQAYALLMIWVEARDQHFKDRIFYSRENKVAMPPLNYSKIVAIFDASLDSKGWGLV